MSVGIKLERETLVSNATPLTIAPQSRVGDVLSAYPQSLDVFLRHGFTPLSNPLLRKTMARVVTVEQACRREGVDLQQLLGELQSISRRDVPITITRN